MRDISVPVREVYMFQVPSGSELARSIDRAVYMYSGFPCHCPINRPSEFTSRPDLKHIHGAGYVCSHAGSVYVSGPVGK